MNLIAITDNKWGIGRDNCLLFHLPPDMERFRSLTFGKVVVMGRKTYESLRVRPLPNRTNVVLTGNSEPLANGVIIANDMQNLLNVLHNYSKEDIMVIGGGQVYSQCLEYCEKAYITKVFCSAEVDTYLDNLDQLGWQIEWLSDVMTYNGLQYQYIIYINTNVCSEYN